MCINMYMQTLSVLQKKAWLSWGLPYISLVATHACWLLEDNNKTESEELDLSPNLARVVQIGKSLILTAVVLIHKRELISNLTSCS